MGTPAKQPLCLPAVNTALSCIPQSLQLSTAQGPRSGMRNNLKQQQCHGTQETLQLPGCYRKREGKSPLGRSLLNLY